MQDTDILFCRKAVVNQFSETIAYYILHPSSFTQEPDTSFLSALFVDVNLNEVTQKKTIYFHISLDALSSLPLQSNVHMVVFIDAKELTEEYLDTLSDLRLDGYQFGLINPEIDQFSSDLLSIFSFIRFSLDKLTINNIIQRSQHGAFSEKRIWINKVETAEQFYQLQANLPESHFSGNAIHKITQVKGKRILAYKPILIELLVALNNRESSPRVLASYIERDPTLTYRIIKLTHSVLYRSQFNVSNAQRAIEIIGIRDLIKWISLVMLGSVPGKPNCLFSMAVSRACFCQSLCHALFPKLEGAFLVGLFSYLPSFLDDELPILLKDLPLDTNIKSALLEYAGNLGGVLKIVMAYEAGRWETIPFDMLEEKKISPKALRDLYVKSLKEARKMGQL